MKATILMLSLATFSLITTAQNQDNNFNRNEIGTTWFSIKSNFGQPFSVQKFYSSFFNGMSYKRHFGKDAIRIGIDYRDRNDKISGEGTGTSSYQETRLRMGYQRMFGNKKIKPFVATDITLINSKSQSESSGGLWAAYKKENLKYLGWGFAPTIGLCFQLTNSLSLTAETSFEILWINNKGTLVSNFPNNISVEQSTEINTIKFVKRKNPLNLISLNYTF